VTTLFAGGDKSWPGGDRGAGGWQWQAYAVSGGVRMWTGAAAVWHWHVLAGRGRRRMRAARSTTSSCRSVVMAN